MKKFFCIIIIILLIFSFGCTKRDNDDGTDSNNYNDSNFGQIVSEEFISGQIKVDGRNRTYNIFVPENNGEELPLIFVLHGGGGNANNAEKMSEMTDRAREKKFIVVYPNGTGKLPNSLLTWNAFSCCGYARENNIDDVKFFSELIEEIENNYNVNEKMIYSTGLSNGGFMSYKLACELSDKFAAVSSVAGAMGEPCNPSESISIISFHGTEDEHVTYDGGTPTQNVDNRTPDKSVEYAINFWTQHNSCNLNSQTEIIDNLDDGMKVVHDTYSCQNNIAVELYTIEGQGHAWPGGKDGLYYGNTDTPTQEISATDLIVDFFLSHPKN